ncbi:MAG: DUF368 domain-containing protein [Paludibacteraceae bacterium]|nr:DUF368 domain-containing protein [Paludibacteraceae bacterium]MBO7234451.1 DUF368 domain-containing protein [Paludibacteraceae bacterium]MBO7258737.1 DUF368 domain-containing protein [Paludibacteraceae bacterium]
MKQWILLYLKGVAMGASDVVPGVSGGTIAFITGIYERLLSAIKSFNITNIKLFFTGKFKQFWKNVDGNFLLCLFAGIATSFLSLAKLITYLIEHHPVEIWSFFFGLIIASTVYVGRGVKWNWKTIISLLLFTILAFFITSPQNAPIQVGSNTAYWYIFLCGAIAICAMILPGISGSFILVLLGQYAFILQSLLEINIPVILVFVIGAVVGIISFSHLLTWLFKHHEMITLSALTGFMIGSLNKIWPWKETLQTYIDRHGNEQALIQKNILPNMDNQFVFAALLILLGIALVLGIEYISNLRKKNQNA